MDRKSGTYSILGGWKSCAVTVAMLQLPVKSVEVGWECLQDEFHKLMDAAKKKKDHDDIFDQLKAAVVDNSVSKHVWEDKAAEVLKVIQLNTLEDRWFHISQFFVSVLLALLR